MSQLYEHNIDEQISDLHRQLAELQRGYHRAAQPIVDQLDFLESLKPPKPHIVPIELPEGQGPLLIRQLTEEAERMIKAACFPELLK